MAENALGAEVNPSPALLSCCVTVGPSKDNAL